MSDPVVLAVVAVVAVIVGIGIGFMARSMVASQAIRASQDKAARIVAEARAQQKELILQAKDEQVRLQRESRQEAKIPPAFRRKSGGPCRKMSKVAPKRRPWQRGGDFFLRHQIHIAQPQPDFLPMPGYLSRGNSLLW